MDQAHAHHSHLVDGEALSRRDPVCGMMVSGPAVQLIGHAGEPVYFCSAHCLTKFRTTLNVICMPKHRDCWGQR